MRFPLSRFRSSEVLLNSVHRQKYAGERISDFLYHYHHQAYASCQVFFRFLLIFSSHQKKWANPDDDKKYDNDRIWKDWQRKNKEEGSQLLLFFHYHENPWGMLTFEGDCIMFFLISRGSEKQVMRNRLVWSYMSYHRGNFFLLWATWLE